MAVLERLFAPGLSCCWKLKRAAFCPDHVVFWLYERRHGLVMKKPEGSPHSNRLIGLNRPFRNILQKTLYLKKSILALIALHHNQTDHGG